MGGMDDMDGWDGRHGWLVWTARMNEVEFRCSAARKTYGVR